MIAIPAAILVRFIPAWNNEILLFTLSSLSIIPLAAWMSRATEHLSERVGPGIGGLLNATFGNAPELIISLMALSKGLGTVVKASIIGSIIGNILLVLGSSILVGGLRFPHLRFNQTATRVAATSLVLAIIGLVIPTIFHHAVEGARDADFLKAEQRLSLSISVLLFGTYLLWLVFSLITHRRLFAGTDSVENQEETLTAWPLSKSLVVLATSTLLVALLSEFLAGSVEATCRGLGLTEVFVGVIIVAIIGNAGEHSTAILAAHRNKMDLSLSITIGSSLQIALFVMPILVFASYWLGGPMTLGFTIPEISAVAIAVGLVTLISGDGECNWVEGVQLLSVYVIMALFFYFLPPGN